MSGQLSLCAGVEVLARTRSGSKAARRRARGLEDHVLPFHRGLCPCAELVRVSAIHAICAARLAKSSLGGPHATPRASAFLQVVVAVFLEARKRQQRQCQDKSTS